MGEGADRVRGRTETHILVAHPYEPAAFALWHAAQRSGSSALQRWRRRAPFSPGASRRQLAKADYVLFIRPSAAIAATKTVGEIKPKEKFHDVSDGRSSHPYCSSRYSWHEHNAFRGVGRRTRYTFRRRRPFRRHSRSRRVRWTCRSWPKPWGRNPQLGLMHRPHAARIAWA